MTIKEKITTIDEAIAQVNACLSYYNSDGSRACNLAVEALRKVEISSFIDAINSVSFPRETLSMGGLLSSMDVREESKREAYRQCVRAIIAILQQARELLVKKQQNEAELESIRLQKESIKWGKIAAFAGITSIIVSIILYLCKN